MPILLPAAGPVMAYGLTNVAIGKAYLDHDSYYGSYYVRDLGSNGLDGVSIQLGEPDSGVFLSPTTGYLTDGNYMVAKTYGRLQGTNDSLLAIIQGGRASPQIYPMALDYSRLAPQSVTYQIFYNGVLQREFTRGTPMVGVNYGYGIYPTVNPLYRRSDGALGTSLTMSQPVSFVFPELLSSGYGDALFIRLNNPAHEPGPVSRIDLFGGGGLYDFSFTDVALGVFGRRHRSLRGPTLHARPNWLQVRNLNNTNEWPGFTVELERLGALNLQVEPFHMAASNAIMFVTATGTAAGQPYTALGTLRIERQLENEVRLNIEGPITGEVQVVVLTNGQVAYAESSTTTVSVPTNALIGAITAHAKTVENLPGFHVQFAEPTLVNVFGSEILADEVRLLLPAPVRMENLNMIHVAVREVDSLTITNEIATAPAGPAPLEIQRLLNTVTLTWPDPNRLLTLWYSDYALEHSYNHVTNPVTFSDPYRSVTVPIVATNKFTFFRLFYQPSD